MCLACDKAKAVTAEVTDSKQQTFSIKSNGYQRPKTGHFCYICLLYFDVITEWYASNYREKYTNRS